MSEMSMGMHVHDRTRGYRSTRDKQTILLQYKQVQYHSRCTQREAGKRNRAQGEHRKCRRAVLRRMQEHLGACGGVNEKGDVGDGDERSPQGPVMSTTLTGEAARCRRTLSAQSVGLSSYLNVVGVAA